MTLNQLLYIITLADEGSLNKAAEKLYMMQPSLTSSLRDNEEHNPQQDGRAIHQRDEILS